MIMTMVTDRQGTSLVDDFYFPRFDRNPTTGEQPGLAAETRPAAQTVYHDAERPSHIVLPVVPRAARGEKQCAPRAERSASLRRCAREFPPP